MMAEAKGIETRESHAYRDNLAHISHELERLDLLIKQEVLRFRLNMEMLKGPKVSRMYISNEEVDRLLDPERCAWVDSPEIRASRDRILMLDQEIHRKVSDSLEQGVFLALPHLSSLFGLSSREVLALIICLAPELDAKYHPLYAYLQDDMTRKRPSMDLILRLLSESLQDAWKTRPLFSRAGKLFRSGILQGLDDVERPVGAGEPACFLRVDPRIVDYILENPVMDVRLSGICRIYTPDRTYEEAPVEPKIQSRVINLVQRHIHGRTGHDKMLLYLNGPYGAGKRTLALAVCKELNCPLFYLDADLLPTDDGELEKTLRLAFREGLLTGALLFLDPVSALRQRADLGNRIYKKISQLISEYGWLVFMAGDKEKLPEECFESMALTPVQIPAADVPTRERAWQTVLHGQPVDIQKTWAAKLSRRFGLTPGRIRRAAQSAEIVGAVDGDQKPLQLSDYYAACRKQSGHGLEQLSVKIDLKYGWQDIVLPEDKIRLLEEICNQVKHRHRVLGEWGFDRKFAYGKGLSVLFSGPPGTGKTMAAQVIARELQLDLYKIDLAGIVSKYIGETEKNLNKIFAAAEQSNAIIFFDEADALFGKRTEVKDAHDRYANIETGYLLQKMEEYEGMAILATNLRANMDEAFTRRIRFMVELPFPDAELRARIWRSHFPKEAPLSGQIDYELLSRQFQIAGGNIRNIVLNTAFLAAEDGEKIMMHHIMHGIRREYEKMGKSWVEKAGNRK